MIREWTTVNASVMFREWPGGVLQGLLAESGLFDNSQALDLVKGILSPGFKDRKFTVGASALESGEYVTWDESTPLDEFAQATVASGSIPGVFPFQFIKSKNLSFVDGGAIMGVDVSSALQRCLEQVADPANVTLDIVLCVNYSKFSSSSFSPATATTIPVFLRAMQLQQYSNSMSAVDTVKRDYPSVNFRFTVAPSVELPSMMDFSPAAIATALKLGYTDGINALQQLSAAFKDDQANAD